MTSTLPRHWRAGLVMLLAGAALSACSHGVSEAGRPGTVAAPAASPADQYDAVIAALDRGETQTASKLLSEIRRHDPNDARARLLGETINIDPVAMLGSRAFSYTLKAGDTLRALAGRYIGDPDKFYALARYNHIAVPDAVTPGQVIRIPGAPAAEHSTPAPRTRSVMAEPSHHGSSPSAKSTPAPQPHADPASAAKYRAAGLDALNRGRVDRAVGLLSRAAALDPGNVLIKHDLDRAQRIRRTVDARK